MVNPDDVAEGHSSFNPTGMSQRLLVDLQRFLACGKIAGQDPEELVAETSLIRDLKEVALLPVSARVSLMFRSAGMLRTCLLFATCYL